MLIRRCLPACAIALAACLSSFAQAATVLLPTDGSWVEFNVDGDLYGDLSLHDYASDAAEGATFSFTVAAGYQATLTVVDLGYSGDAFTLSNNGSLLGSTGAAVASDPSGEPQFSADAALADTAFSRGVFTLGAGSHAITGVLSTSLLGMDATNGALKVTVSAVPEPATVASLLAGLALVGATLRRRAR